MTNAQRFKEISIRQQERNSSQKHDDGEAAVGGGEGQTVIGHICQFDKSMSFQ